MSAPAASSNIATNPTTAEPMAATCHLMLPSLSVSGMGHPQPAIMVCDVFPRPQLVSSRLSPAFSHSRLGSTFAPSLIHRPERLMDNQSRTAAGAGIDVALGIDAQELGAGAAGDFFVGNKCLHPASLDVSDADAPFPAGIPVRVRHAIRHVNVSLGVDCDRARLSELRPSRDEGPVLVQNLNALVSPV